MQLGIKGIFPKGKLFQSGTAYALLQAAQDDSMESLKSAFLKTVGSWSEKPEFETEKEKLNRKVYTTSKIYGYINNGTSVRYAVMTPDFQAKSQPGVIDSVPGAGGLWFISKKHPRPGIQARKFDQSIAKTIKYIVLRNLKGAMKNVK